MYDFTDVGKTNPIKPNLVRRPVRRLVRRSFSEVGSFSEDGSLGEGGFKRATHHRLSSRIVYLAGTITRNPTSQALAWNLYLESGYVSSGGDKQEPPQITGWVSSLSFLHHSQTLPIIS